MTASFSELVGCRLPLQLAPMGGGVGTPELAAAVCESGGLGMLSSVGPAPLDQQIAALRRLTQAPYGVGFFGFDLSNRAADLELAATQSRVVDIFWGEPDAEVVARVHSGGALAFWQVGSTVEAVAAADAGCDVVIAQGVEAGGHVRGTTPLLRLLEDVLAQTDLPVVAAGGIATRAQVRQVLDAGAAGVRIGTRLLATTDSAAHPAYLAALVAAEGADTELTTAFHVGWEDAPHRVLRAAISAATAATEPVALLAVGDQQLPIGRWSAMPPTAACSGEVTAMAMYSGIGVGAITEIASVDSVVRALF